MKGACSLTVPEVNNIWRQICEAPLTRLTSQLSSCGKNGVQRSWFGWRQGKGQAKTCVFLQTLLCSSCASVVVFRMVSGLLGIGSRGGSSVRGGLTLLVWVQTLHCSVRMSFHQSSRVWVQTLHSSVSMSFHQSSKVWMQTLHSSVRMSFHQSSKVWMQTLHSSVRMTFHQSSTASSANFTLFSQNDISSVLHGFQCKLYTVQSEWHFISPPRLPVQTLHCSVRMTFRQSSRVWVQTLHRSVKM